MNAEDYLVYPMIMLVGNFVNFSDVARYSYPGPVFVNSACAGTGEFAFCTRDKWPGLHGIPTSNLCLF